MIFFSLGKAFVCNKAIIITWSNVVSLVRNCLKILQLHIKSAFIIQYFSICFKPPPHEGEFFMWYIFLCNRCSGGCRHNNILDQIFCKEHPSHTQALCDPNSADLETMSAFTFCCALQTSSTFWEINFRIIYFCVDILESWCLELLIWFGWGEVRFHAVEASLILPLRGTAGVGAR